MSYRLDLCFKNCKPKDVYKNMCEFEELVLKNADKYIKDNLIYVRIDRERDVFYNNGKINEFISTLFKHHIWYCEEISALCVVWGSDIKEINDWFDGYVYFQDSCDQDYEYETWDFNKSFRKIKNRIKKMKTDKFVKEYIQSNDYYDEDDKEDILKNVDYYRRTFVYQTIENIIDPIWKGGFGISYIDGVLDQNKFMLTKKAIRLLVRSDSSLKDLFGIKDE